MAPFINRIAAISPLQFLVFSVWLCWLCWRRVDKLTLFNSTGLYGSYQYRLWALRLELRLHFCVTLGKFLIHSEPPLPNGDQNTDLTVRWGLNEIVGRKCPRQCLYLTNGRWDGSGHVA